MDNNVQEATSMQPLNLFDYEALAGQRMSHIPWAWVIIRAAVRMR
jgi:hypothetical protein